MFLYVEDGKTTKFVKKVLKMQAIYINRVVIIETEKEKEERL
jgi:hypothetical protein